MNAHSNTSLWGVFVGDNGEQLEIFNSISKPFPPTKNDEGYIAIGWPAIGDMRMYEDKYAEFVEKFSLVYPEESTRVLKTKANMLWYFAFDMKPSDWVISPCSEHELLFVGKITGPYHSDYHNDLKLYGRRRYDFVHTRKVRWEHIIPKSAAKYSKLNRIGQLTVSRPNITIDDLQTILAK